MTVRCWMAAAVLICASSNIALAAYNPIPLEAQRSNDATLLGNLRERLKAHRSGEEPNKRDTPREAAKSASSKKHESQSCLGRCFSKRPTRSPSAPRKETLAERSNNPSSAEERRFDTLYEDPNELVPMHSSDRSSTASSGSRGLTSQRTAASLAELRQGGASNPVPGTVLV